MKYLLSFGVAVATIAVFVAGAWFGSNYFGTTVIREEGGVGAEVLAAPKQAAYESATVATTTWCALNNAGSRRRWITDYFAWKDATSSQTNISVATGTIATGNSASSTSYMTSGTFGLGRVAMIPGVGTSTPTWNNSESTTTSSHLRLWGPNEILKFIASTSLNTTERGGCGVEYIIDPDVATTTEGFGAQ